MGRGRLNVIDQNTKREDLLNEYKKYGNVLEGETLHDRPWIWNRLGPIFYETPVGSTVLDVGCNAGDFVEILEKDRGCKAFGIDVSEICVEEARKKGRSVELSDGHKIPFPDNYFDVVYLNEVLIHVFSPNEVLREVKRVLKETGFLLGSTPHKNLSDNFWEENFSHREYYNETTLKSELESVFEKAYIRTLTGGQFALSMAQSAGAQEPAEMLFKCGGENTKGWEEALQDKSILRVWMGFTQPPADVYYRMTGFAEKMRDKGAEIAYEPFSHENLDSTQEWQGKIQYKHVQNQLETLLRVADMSIWQITPNKNVLAFLMCAKDLLKKPILAECDDWLFDLPSYNLASAPYKPNSDAEWVAYKQIELSDAVIVSTEFLKENLEAIFPGKTVYVVKNSIDFNLWDHVKPYETIPPKKEGVIRIGYTGCANHDGDVEIIKKPLLALLDEIPNLEIVFPLQFPSYQDVSHERFIFVNKWLPFNNYPGMVKGWDLDVGVAPLRDNNLNRAKSNLRWLEFGALKIPSVMSKVRPFQESIVNGQTGYLCSSKKDWYERLKALIESKEERKRIGQNAYREIRENYNMDKVSDGYKELLNHIKKEALR